MPSEDGILAILDGCPILEYFDLGEWYSDYVSDSLMKRCSEQIKVFVPPLQGYYLDLMVMMSTHVVHYRFLSM